MGKAAGYREQQLEYARIIGANTEADIVRKRGAQQAPDGGQAG